MIYRLDIEYCGTNYRGWQVQKNAVGVANLLQQACQKLFNQAGDMHAAGRTDSGVHALQQVVHLSLPAPLPRLPRLQELNDLLPADIAVKNFQTAPAGFHARHSAVERVYLYQILCRRSAFGRDLSWWIKDRLDLKAMQAAGQVFLGNHDFASFCQQDPKKKENTRLNLNSLEIEQQGALILLRLRAPRFLWKMVRRITGYLVEVGRGRFKPEETGQYLKKFEPSLAPYTAPPSGLFLERVLYSGEKYEAPLKPVLYLSRD